MAEISDSVLVAEQTPLLLPRGEARSEAHSAECSCRKIVASAADRLTPSPNDKTSAKPYPKVADIPITCPERLLQAAVTATTATDNSDNGLGAMDRNVHPSTPATTTTTTTGPPVPKTYLYLAYGSNLAAETFLGRRGLRPISRINVSAPAFDLNFGLPGLPYWEPCFANVEPRRKIPQPPHRPPFNPPKPPPIDPSPAPPSPGNPPPPLRPASSSGGEKGSVLFPALPPKDGPTWTKGLYGVVYEVTAEDYATIVKTEGGGASYKDVVTPCIPLPPSMHVPETPPIPELPRPFLAHTLYAPRLPVPPPEHDEGGAADVDEKSRESSKDDDGHDHDGDDGDHGGNDGCKGKLRKYFGRFLLPVQRPVDYAQPSLRYLTLLRDGARENDLPDEYQAYLAELHHYAITTSRQTVGKFLYGLLWFPWFALLLGVSRIFADRDTGKVPAWLGVMMTVLVNVMWASYDGVFKKWFGDGERTEAAQGDRDGDEGTGEKWNVWSGYGKRRRNSFVLPGQGVGAVRDEEKNRLLDDW